MDDKFTKAALKRKYDSIYSYGTTYGEHKRHLEFSHKEYNELFSYANNINIPMTASAMDTTAVDLLVNRGPPFIKIGSGDASNPILQEKVAKIDHMNAVISTGMCDWEDVKSIYSLFRTHRKESANFVLLHCTSAYPTPVESTHLKVINWYTPLWTAS